MVNPKLLRQMQTRLGKLQEELADLKVESIAGGGSVRVVATGQQTLHSVHIDPSVVDSGDVEMLQDLVLVAANDALAQAREAASKRFAGLTGNIKIPGLL